MGQLAHLGNSGGSWGIYKTIAVPADFPTLAEVRARPKALYGVVADVTDNDATKTNTGESFVEGDIIFFDLVDTKWVKTTAPSPSWGAIVGTLPSQTDLQGALNAKEPTISNLPYTKGGTGINSLTGQAAKVLKVKGDETGYELVETASGASWGEITGTLSDQTDLQNALDAKLNNFTYRQVSSNTTINFGEIINPFLSVGNITLTLESCAGNVGNLLIIEIDYTGNNTLTIVPASGETIDGSSAKYFNEETKTIIISASSTGEATILLNSKLPAVAKSVDPTSNDDYLDIGQSWINIVTQSIFICVNASTGNAVWTRVNSEYINFTNIAISSTTNADYGNNYIADASSGNFSVNCPISSSSNKGKNFRVINDGASGTIEVIPNGGGSPLVELQPNESVWVFSNGTECELISKVSDITSSGGGSSNVSISATNDTGVSLSKGDVVRVTHDGTQVVINLAQANNDTNISGVIGLLKEDVANLATGEVIIAGEVSGLNTSSHTTGDKIYLSNLSIGEWVTTAPTAQDSYVIEIGEIVESNASTGTIQVNVKQDMGAIGFAGTQALTYEGAHSAIGAVVIPVAYIKYNLHTQTIIASNNIDSASRSATGDLTINKTAGFGNNIIAAGMASGDPSVTKGMIVSYQTSTEVPDGSTSIVFPCRTATSSAYNSRLVTVIIYNGL